MTTNMRLITAALLVITTASGAAEHPPEQPDRAAALSAEFRAPDWTRRRAAFEQLKQEPQLLTTTQRKQILTEVLNRENSEIDSAFREGPGASLKYGESYSDYTAWLASYLFSIIGVEDVDALVAVANTAYHSNSVLAVRLAAYGEALVRTVETLAASDISPKRWQAFGLAAQMHVLHRKQEIKAPLSAASLTRLKGVLIAGTQDAEVTNRTVATRSIGLTGLTEFLPLLGTLAENDPGVTTDRGIPEYPVRNAAIEAIARIQSGQ